MDPYIPFCGTPPELTEIWSRWQLDPVLLTGLGLGFVVLWVLAPSRGRALAGWAMVALLFVSPICAASMALFSARVAQHVLLTLVAAPILALAWPSRRAFPVPMAVLFAALFWFWHIPAPYAATLTADWIYLGMQVSLLGSAWLMWSHVFASLRRAPGVAVIALVLTAWQMTTLSALLVFSAQVWHGWHLVTAQGFGLTALEDQQLAGAIMWTAGGALTLLTCALAARHVLAGGRQKRGPSEVEPASS